MANCAHMVDRFSTIPVNSLAEFDVWARTSLNDETLQIILQARAHACSSSLHKCIGRPRHLAVHTRSSLVNTKCT